MRFGLSRGGFNGLDEFGERGEVMFHLPDGIGVSEGGERRGIGGQRGALRRLAEQKSP